MSLDIEATEAKNVIDIEAGVYQAMVEKVEPADGTFGEQIKFTFDVDGLQTDDGEPLALWGWCSQKLNPKCKLWKWVKAITGQEPVKGQTYDLEKLVGRRCSLLVMREESDEGTRCRVQDVLAPKMGKRAAPAPEPPAADAGTCSECPADVSYFTAQGVGYCDSHGPKAATVAVE